MILQSKIAGADAVKSSALGWRTNYLGKIEEKWEYLSMTKEFKSLKELL